MSSNTTKVCKICGEHHNAAVVVSLRSSRRYAFMRYYWQGEPNFQAWETRRTRAILLKYQNRATIETVKVRRGVCNLCVTKPAQTEAASAAATFVTPSAKASQEMGRPRQYSSNAERQRAYRDRKKK